MTPDSVSSAAAPGAGASTAAGVVSAEAGEDRFLRLLVAQLRNQDPLNPLDNAEVTTQMAQISAVSGIDRLNATLRALAGAMGESQSMQAAALIGREVLLEGDGLEWVSGAARGGFELEADANAVTVTIRDAAGSVVHRADLGAQQAGIHRLEWDGMTDAGAPAQAGRYSFGVSARTADAEVKAKTLSAARVLGVAREASGATSLELSGIGRRSYADIKQII
jgi:flagellar basal-body rod modification protein FlgD